MWLLPTPATIRSDVQLVLSNNCRSWLFQVSPSSEPPTDEQRLRAILDATPLTAEIKWGAPCYTFNGKNVVGLMAFKSYFGLWFHQGVALKDEASVLINAQEGKTKALRQWRMTSVKDIKPAIVKRYLKEAIEIASA